ncbi:hypothetical protein ACTWQF_04080 [Streptomyces sp. 8N114]|uniref:hypothetical protein n=1 Tax=Streptomyces sp. 8N114 TaxID=3457419 RepID=UPI003FD2FA5C
MSNSRRALTTCAVAMSAAALTFVSPGVAQAGENGKACTDKAGSYERCAGFARFQAEGEHFYLSDRSTDGAGVFLQITVDGVVLDPSRKNLRGAGTTIDFNSSWAEGRKVEFIVCLMNNGVIQKNTCNSGHGKA